MYQRRLSLSLYQMALGQHVVTGAADGEFLRISREQDSVTFRRGVKGFYAYSLVTS